MSKTRTIAVVTGTRAEYGLLAPVMRAIQAQRGLELAVVVTGMHLVTGTWREIDFPIAAKVRMQPPGSSGKSSGRAADVAAVGRGVSGLGRVFAKLKFGGPGNPEDPGENPGVVMVLGDRIEAFAAATAGSIGGIRVAHIHGGDRAEGVADEAMRHAISKLSHIHFAATALSRKRLIRMGEISRQVFNVGSPAMDGLNKIAAASDAYLQTLDIDPARPFVVVLQHPVGGSDKQEQQWMAATLKATSHVQRLVLSPNGDPGCVGVLRALRGAKIRPTDHFHREQFVGLLKRAGAIVGNSSAGLIEAAAARPGGVPAVNIGPRQNGREKPGNVVDCDPTVAAVRWALAKAMNRRRRKMSHPYGSGRTGERIANILERLDFTQLALHKRNAY